MKRIIITMLLFILPACSSINKDFMVTGKVAREKKPMSKVKVYAYKAGSLIDFKKPDFTSESDSDGKFKIRIPDESEYYITAKRLKSDENKTDLYAYYGKNPIYITKNGHTNINLNLQKADSGIAFEEAEETVIKSILTHNGTHLSGANLFVALDLNEGMQTKGFVQSDLSGDNGEASVLVENGTYYLTARKRNSNAFGPLSEGDLIGFFHENPVVIDKTGTYTISIELVEIPKKSADKANSSAAKISVSGRIVDVDDNPVKGLWVGAYKDHQMFGKPLHLSGKSDKDGNYTLILPKPGKFYIAARDTLGGPPNPGDLYGSYSGTDDHSVTVEIGGKLSGIDITVLEMW